ncbi:MAG: 3-isopropylmalate dehydratase small subunit [Spirochaetaceae bacterium]|nr:3-isopropylmalate dehydratase small subunit [Spirochaetaceae bacterium]
MSINIKDFTGKGITVRGNDIDTDRIIPARFMKCVTFEGLGAYAFNDERVDANGNSRGHSFDNKSFSGHPVLVSNANFGCGSSREHAPQALRDWGIRALICESFAEIFAGNCSSLGMPAVSLEHNEINELQTLIEEEPDIEIYLNVETMMINAGSKKWKASMAEAYRQALLDGSWDSTAVLAAGISDIQKVASELPYI